MATAFLCSVHWIMPRLARTGRAGETALTISLIAIGWFFYYVPFQQTIAGIAWRASRDEILVPVGSLATVAAMCWLALQPGDRVAYFNRFMQRLGLVLCGLQVARITIRPVLSPASSRREPVSELLLPVHTTGPIASQRNS